MSDVEQLKQAYRNIKAPPYLATRIRAGLPDCSVRSQRLVPVAATVALAIIAVTIIVAVKPPPDCSARCAPPGNSHALTGHGVADDAGETRHSFAQLVECQKRQETADAARASIEDQS